MKNNLPFVSVIIPCRNEEKFIGQCLDSIIAQDYPKDQLKVLVVDGMSEDRTRGIVKEYVKRHQFIKILDNSKKITPVALNIGIKQAKGEIVMRMDAHTNYEKDYISKCIKNLKEYKADNVGGIWKIVPRDNTNVGKAIAHSLSHPFGIGNAYYRFASNEARWVDTVPFFCYKKEIFNKIGLFNENLARGQDMEFNLRLKKAGYKTLLVPEIVSYYHARSDLRSFCKHNFSNGLWAILPFKFTNHMPVSWRHLVPLAFVSSLIVSAMLGLLIKPFFWLFLVILGIYGLGNLAASLQIAWQERDIRYIFAMPLVFGMLHIGYGLGSLWGAIKLVKTPNFWNKLFGLEAKHETDRR